MNFWDSLTNIKGTQWIVESAGHAARKYQPRFTYIYLPHLDYAAQKFGPDSPQALAALGELDAAIGRLVDGFADAGLSDVLWVVASEYVITPVSGVGYPNRRLREAHMLTLRDDNGAELLDVVSSRAWAPVDHQLAHVFVRDAVDIERTAALFHDDPAVAEVLTGSARARRNLDHPRAGDVVLISKPEQWFAYYWWLDDAKAPKFAAHGRHPPQAGLRPGRNVYRHADALDTAECGARQRLARLPCRQAGRARSARLLERGPGVARAGRGRFPTPMSRESSSVISASRGHSEGDLSNPARKKTESPTENRSGTRNKVVFVRPRHKINAGNLSQILARPAAAGRVVEADVAAAALLAAAVERLAARLHDRAARLVAAACR